MLVLAHRGYHDEAHENTLAAFAAAVALGVDGIETDVRLCADGKAVIMHDRVTPAGRAVGDITHREIEVDVGHAVPVLADVLEAFPDVLLNIEIKLAGAWPVAAPILKAFQHKRRLLISSFRHEVVAQCAMETGIECALLMASRPLDVGGMIAASAGQPSIRGIVWDYNIVDAAVIERVAAAGWANYVYGAVTMDEHRHCGNLGLAGLITDHPQRARLVR
jgi:glycerophosphoryl diester phosphodiesterase